MKKRLVGCGGYVALAGVLLALPPAAVSAQQLNADQAAQLLLDSAKRAFNEGKFDFAVEKFREFAQKYEGHRDSAAAGYGLALSLWEAPEPDYKQINEALRRVLGRTSRASFPEYGFVLYYFADSLGALGEEALSQAAARPNEAKNLQSAARQSFAEAARQFAAAAETFEALARPSPATAPAAAKELDWAARARCDQCEALLRLESFAEAEKTAAAVLAHPVMGKGAFRELALYHLGYAQFAQGRSLEAGRALSQLAPFGQTFGLHARYLLARMHHLAGERPEAAAQYQAVLSGSEERRKQAAEALKNPRALSPRQRAATEAVARGPLPDYVPRASFYLAQLQAEEGRYADALKGFGDLLQRQGDSPLAPEAQLRAGYCHLQMKNAGEALKALQPLHQHPQLGDRASWWSARAQVDAADRNNAQAFQQALAGAMDLLRQAAEKANQLAKTDAAARARRGDILMELGDVQQLAGQPKEAAATYAQVAADGADTQRAEEAVQRQATALHLAGMYNESDAVCRRFEQVYPRSTLLPAVLFRSAENAYFGALAAEKADPPDPRRLDRLYAEAIGRYERLIGYSPDFAYANLARQALATLHYRQQRYARAAELLGAIPETDRTGDLAGVSYMLADCLLRSLPPEGDDAVSAARLVAQLDRAARLLEAFVGAAGKAAQVPDALLKLGQCHQRIAGIITDGNERRRLLDQARQACERIQRDFAQDPAVPMALFQRAQCLAMLGDPHTAANELKRFQGDPLRTSPAAPLAMARLGRLLRATGRAPEAVAALAAYRAEQEAELLTDPQRRGWAAMLQYEHALALVETGKAAEAVPIFDALIRQFAGSPEALSAIWRRGQCRREELTAQLGEAQKLLARGEAKPEQLAAAAQQVQQALAALREALGPVHAEAENLAGASPGSAAHLHMLYEVAWGYRVLADAEVGAARERLQREAMEKARAALARTVPPGQTPPEPAMPEVPLADIPVQPSEKIAQVQYERLIAAAPDAPLAVQARFELAEMHLDRMDNPDRLKAATRLLGEAVEKSPPRELAEPIRLRLATCLLAAGDEAGALGQLAGLGEKPAHGYTPGYVRYLTAEALIRRKDWAKAAQQLAPFQDDGNLRNIPNISERAMLRLGQACVETGQWDRAVQACQATTQRYPSGPYLPEAFYGLGWALQNLKRHDEAVKAYAEVLRRTVAEAAAKAQFQTGICRLEQGKGREAVMALLAVPLTYDYPEWSAAAWCEAGRACEALKETDEAVRLYRRTVTDHGGSPWAETARKRLAALGAQ